MPGRNPAPGALATLQRFVNTNDREAGTERIGTPEALRDWLAEAGLLDTATPLGSTEHEQALALREAIRAILSGDETAVARVNAAAHRAGLHPVLSSSGASVLEPAAGGIDGALGRLVAILHGAVADGTWERLKACERDRCRWAFYDHSKNHSGRWCDMDVCGAKEKSARAYRRRRASESAKSPSGSVSHSES